MIYAELDRFGYLLTTIAETEEQAVKAIMEEYERAFISQNGYSPREELADHGNTDVSFYENAKEDIYTTEYESGIVRWI